MDEKELENVEVTVESSQEKEKEIKANFEEAFSEVFERKAKIPAELFESIKKDHKQVYEAFKIVEQLKEDMKPLQHRLKYFEGVAEHKKELLHLELNHHLLTPEEKSTSCTMELKIKSGEYIVKLEGHPDNRNKKFNGDKSHPLEGFLDFLTNR